MKFYMTLGQGQPYYPGYFVCEANDEYEAMRMTAKALNGRWCSTHDRLETVHHLDRIYRGVITEEGINECDAEHMK